ncbi:MAG: chorismate mutase [Rickettsiales bacterium]|nr:chorismate mutase [Rickettsiales bacterium]
MENQQNKSAEVTLEMLRQDIDNIDNKIIALLNQRMKVIDRVGELKKNNHENFFIRAAREADMIKELIKKSDGNFPHSAIVGIWRKIIAAANMHEQKIKIALHNPKNIADYFYLLREYYFDAVPIYTHDSATNIVSDLEKNEAQIGVFALPKNNNEDFDKSDITENWWIGLANNKSGIKIFAKIPFLEVDNKLGNNDNKINLVALAIKAAERSKQDNSLFYLEVKKEISRSQVSEIFAKQNLTITILKSVKLPQIDDIIFYLIEVAGFFEDDSAAIKELKQSKIRPYIKVLGSYAVPIKI